MLVWNNDSLLHLNSKFHSNKSLHSLKISNSCQPFCLSHLERKQHTCNLIWYGNKFKSNFLYFVFSVTNNYHKKITSWKKNFFIIKSSLISPVLLIKNTFFFINDKKKTTFILDLNRKGSLKLFIVNNFTRTSPLSWCIE